MRVLVYRIGVIDSLTVHELCHTGNEVKVAARSRWREVLSHQGLRIRWCQGSYVHVTLDAPVRTGYMPKSGADKHQGALSIWKGSNRSGLSLGLPI